ncbi:adenosylcobinamide-GDP ribazoletransferase [Desulfofustis glycolicus]|uniref:Adenosylcobinamide-GDP ribazoletransferase n=1 Tax=Desulfofustis glycolicus DSM 9705 TaxID=1121409 RepID=A0A1M5WYK2_9BACT|nr:adenosylcobinamide-GDP ribazoletransferase [Desulfofustis glycolicus]MCB2214503.1 adenosylcobinamide-GDP ribazoletransferase [Desulfobulbaceae bacterium]SHH91993.1 cobalamin-5'-phosphate synthase [Desulfofustis glycolicus DSM 9705]
MPSQHRESSARRAVAHPVRSLLTALGFLSIIPITTRDGDERGEFAAALFYFPLVGLLLGGLAAVFFLVLQPILPPLVVGALLAVLLSLLSGFIHLDGLADSADGFFSGTPRERCLEIMRDSRIGVMGSAAICSLLVIKVAALASIDGGQMIVALLVAATGGRVGIVCMMALLPYARSGSGLGLLFYGGATRQAAVVSILLLAVLVLVSAGHRFMPIFTAAAALLLLLAALCRKKIGGATGDTLGATCEMMEATILIVFSMTL